MGILIFAVLSFNMCFGFSAKVDLPKNARFVLAIKKEGIVKVIENKKGKLETTFESTASYGTSSGTKNKEGDNKTPTGVYFGIKLLSSDELPEDTYGPMAIVLNYPNPIDLVAKKTGSGIWIHGTNESTRLGPKKATQGCVILENAKLLKLVSLMRLNQVPLIITDSANTVTTNIIDGKTTNITVEDGNIKYRISTELEKSKDMVYEVIK